MNSQRGEQSIKQILDKCGEEIIQNHNAFRSAVFDLLDEVNDNDERLTLKHAMESNVFWILLETPSVTVDSAKKAIEQMQKESRMTKEDAEFAVRCVVAARGKSPDIVKETTNGQQGGEKKRQKEEKKRQRKTQKNKEEQNSNEQVQLSGSLVADNKYSWKKQIITVVILTVLFWGVTFIIFYLVAAAEKPNDGFIFGGTTVIAIPAACWVQKAWNESKKMKSVIVKGIILGIIWGVAAFILWFVICEGIGSSYYNYEYWTARNEMLHSIGREEGLRVVNDLWRRSASGSFSYNGQYYGLNYERELALYLGSTMVVCIFFILIQKIVWSLIRRRKKS